MLNAESREALGWKNHLKTAVVTTLPLVGLFL